MPSLLAPVVVGRSAELAALRAGADAAARGAGSTILLTGEAGVGKSRLLREVRRWCAEQNRVVLVGRAVDTTSPVPFRPIAEALLAAYRMDPAGLGPDVAPFQAALGRLVPGWSDPSVAAGSAVPLLHVAEGFLRVARARAGTAVLLDDLQWADAETLSVVEYLADNIAGEPVLLVLSARPDRHGAVRGLFALAERRVATHLRLNRLDPARTVDMTRACLGDLAVPAGVLEFISGRADGLPLFVEELLAGLVSDGALTRRANRWSASNPDRGRAPRTFAEAIRRGVGSLSTTAQRVLHHAALLGRRIDPELLATVSGTARIDVDQALEAARGLNLLGVGENGLNFRHALTRDALVADLFPEERAARAAAALNALRAARPKLEDYLGEVAADLAEVAGDRPAAAELLLDLGRRALRLGALNSAESALRRAARHASGGLFELEVDEALVETLALAGRADEAFPIGEVLLARLTDTAGTTDPDGRRRAEVHVALARAAVACTDWPLAASHLERVGELSASGADLIRTAQVNTMRVVVALGEGRLDDAEALAPTAVESAERTGSADLRCEALLVQGRCAQIRNLDAAEQAFDRARSIAHAAGLAHREARALAERGSVDAWRDGGSARLIEARALAAACGAPETEAVTENALAVAAWFRGDGGAMHAHATAALTLSRRYRLGMMVAASLSLCAAAHGLRGDATAMETMLREAATSVADEPTQLIARHVQCRAVCALAHDDLATARTEFAHAAAMIRDRPAATVPPMVVMHVLVETVHGAAPATILAGLEQVSRRDVPLMAGVLHAAEAISLGRAGDIAAATARMNQALRELHSNSFLHAVVIGMVAPVLIADGWGDPAGWLTTAHQIFEDRGMPEPANACRTLLRKLGAPVASTASTSDGITGREREVLHLVAEGLANKAVAERLFLSPRTVEKYVERLLAKTGSVNRSQLVTYALGKGTHSRPDPEDSRLGLVGLPRLPQDVPEPEGCSRLRSSPRRAHMPPPLSMAAAQYARRRDDNGHHPDGPRRDQLHP